MCSAWSKQASSHAVWVSVLLFEKVCVVVQAAEGDQDSIMNGDKVEQSRWVVPANGSQTVVVQFQSEEMGSFRENLVFEVSFFRSHGS